MATGRVTVGTPEKQESYVINGEQSAGDSGALVITVGDALDKFFGDSDPFEGRVISLNGEQIDEDKADQDLRAGDVILCMSASLASGGVKGA